jgi:hypothetical protein
LFPGNSSISRREVIFTHARFKSLFSHGFLPRLPKTRFFNGVCVCVCVCARARARCLNARTIASHSPLKLFEQVVPVKLCGALGDVIRSSRELIDNRAIFNAVFDKSCDLNGAPASCFNQLSRLVAVPILVDSLPFPSEGGSTSSRVCVGAVMLLRSEWNWDLEHVQHVSTVAMTLAHLLPLALRE